VEYIFWWKEASGIVISVVGVGAARWLQSMLLTRCMAGNMGMQREGIASRQYAPAR
jgi:hypothetical protein